MRRRRPVLPILAALAAGLVVSAIVLTAKPGDKSLFPARPGEPSITVYLLDNGFHTDLSLPREAVMARGGPLARAAAMLAPRPWIAVGWGDASFYTRHGLSAARAKDAVRALFGRDNPSVVHLYGTTRRPDLAYAKGVARPIVLSREGFERLAARADRSFALRGGSPVLPLSPEPDEGFFDSVEHFGARKVCNHWTAELLNAAGLPTTGVLDGTAPGLMLDLRIRAGIKG